MPLYEYECEVCNHRFEVIQKFSDAPIAACPVCGGAVTKLFSSPAIQFKGSGFYITDYARAGKGGGAAAGKGDKSESTASSDSKESSSKSAESSSDSKAESKPTKTSKTESATPAAPATKSSSD